MYTEYAGSGAFDVSDDLAIRRLREVSLPSDFVPLSRERRPFESLSDEAVLGYFKFFQRYPEALGRLSIALKRAFGLKWPCPVHFTIKESHFDLNTLDPGFLDQMVPLGFEPDHFATLNPPEYKWCLTMKMEIPVGVGHASRVRDIHDMMYRHSLDAKSIAECNPSAFGYLEMETYSSRTRHVQPFRVVSDEGLESFPFAAGEFEQVVPPSTEAEARTLGLQLDIHKLVDVHVKLPTGARGGGFEGADSARMVALKEKFISAGFYEIYSEAGNHIYTVQLLDARPGKSIFLMLRDWANAYGGLVGIKMETCNYFYRTPRKIDGKIKLAPIPNLVHWRNSAQ